VALARALQAPDVIPEATVTRNAEPEFAVGWRAAVSVAVPVFTRHTAGVRVEQASLAQARADAQAAGARIAGAVASAAAIATAGQAQYARYRDEILPRAVEVEQMAADAYRLGQTGIAPYLQALQTSRDVRLRALQASLDFQNALADLEQAMGAPLP
jgi:cobalt-zinc-cadmium efflux system outer membrane protein